MCHRMDRYEKMSKEELELLIKKEQEENAKPVTHGEIDSDLEDMEGRISELEERLSALEKKVRSLE